MPSDFYQCHCDERSDVIDSRAVGGDGPPYIRRRRECPKCGVRFTTVEVIAAAGRGYRSRVPYDSESARQDRKLWKQNMVSKLGKLIAEISNEE